MIRVTIPVVWMPTTNAWYDYVALPVGICAYCRGITSIRHDLRDRETGNAVKACQGCAVQHTEAPETERLAKGVA